FIVALSPWVAARAPQTATTEPAVEAVKRLEGAWVRRDFEGAGSFGGLGQSIPPAQLKPDAAAAGARGGGGRGGRGGGAPGGGGRGPGRGAPVETTPHEAGDPYIVSQMPCGGGGGRGGGALLLNPDSGGVHLVVSKTEAILAGERGGVRHIYLDNRPHP